jgi:hypothetical protein
MIKLICQKHPKYTGQRQPRVNCKECWEIYNNPIMSKSQQVMNYIQKLIKENIPFKEAAKKAAEEFKITYSTVKKYYKIEMDKEDIEEEIQRKREQEKGAYWKKRFNTAMKIIAARDSLEEAICSEILPVNYLSPPVYYDYSYDKKESIGSAIISDGHFGQVITLEEMGGTNEFNFDIGCARLHHIAKEIIYRVHKESFVNNIKKLHIDILGDMINDENRDEHKWTNQ